MNNNPFTFCWNHLYLKESAGTLKMMDRPLRLNKFGRRLEKKTGQICCLFRGEHLSWWNRGRRSALKFSGNIRKLCQKDVLLSLLQTNNHVKCGSTQQDSLHLIFVAFSTNICGFHQLVWKWKWHHPLEDKRVRTFRSVRCSNGSGPQKGEEWR